MEILKTEWFYVWMLAGILAALLGGLWLGIKIGQKWGREDAKYWFKLKFNAFLQSRLGQPVLFLNDAYTKGSKNGARVQGVLEIDSPDSEAFGLGLPFSFKFIPDKKQWQPGPCCDPEHK